MGACVHTARVYVQHQFSVDLCVRGHACLATCEGNGAPVCGSVWTDACACWSTVFFSCRAHRVIDTRTRALGSFHLTTSKQQHGRMQLACRHRPSRKRSVHSTKTRTDGSRLVTSTQCFGGKPCRHDDSSHGDDTTGEKTLFQQRWMGRCTRGRFETFARGVGQVNRTCPLLSRSLIRSIATNNMQVANCTTRRRFRESDAWGGREPPCGRTVNCR
jgi:hypothetical protein